MDQAGLSRPILKNVGLLKKTKKSKQLGFLGFLIFKSGVLLFISNYVNLFELIGVAISS